MLYNEKIANHWNTIWSSKKVVKNLFVNQKPLIPNFIPVFFDYKIIIQNTHKTNRYFVVKNFSTPNAFLSSIKYYCIYQTNSDSTEYVKN